MDSFAEQRRELRTAFMKWLYEKTSASTTVDVRPEEFAIYAGMSGHEALKAIYDAVRFLESEGLVSAQMGPEDPFFVNLTHSGIKEMEAAQEEPAKRTQHLGPITNNNIIIHGNVTASQLQQATSGSSQSGTLSANASDLVRTFITEARKVVESSGLDEKDRNKVESDLTSMEVELASDHPHGYRLKAAGQSVMALLYGALGEALTQSITEIPWDQVMNAFQ